MGGTNSVLESGNGILNPEIDTESIFASFGGRLQDTLCMEASLILPNEDAKNLLPPFLKDLPDKFILRIGLESLEFLTYIKETTSSSISSTNFAINSTTLRIFPYQSILSWSGTVNSFSFRIFDPYQTSLTPNNPNIDSSSSSNQTNIHPSSSYLGYSITDKGQSTFMIQLHVSDSISIQKFILQRIEILMKFQRNYTLPSEKFQELRQHFESHRITNYLSNEILSCDSIRQFNPLPLNWKKILDTYLSINEVKEKSSSKLSKNDDDDETIPVISSELESEVNHSILSQSLTNDSNIINEIIPSPRKRRYLLTVRQACELLLLVVSHHKNSDSNVMESEAAFEVLEFACEIMSSLLYPVASSQMLISAYSKDSRHRESFLLRIRSMEIPELSIGLDCKIRPKIVLRSYLDHYTPLSPNTMLVYHDCC